MRLAPLRLEDVSEKEWAATVADLAKTLGWLRYHTYRSERSEAGFPDEVLIRERVIYLELKRESGKLSDAQKRWLSALLAAGAEVYVCRPRDLDALARILAARGDPLAVFQGECRVDASRLRAALRDEVG